MESSTKLERLVAIKDFMEYSVIRKYAPIAAISLENALTENASVLKILPG